MTHRRASCKVQTPRYVRDTLCEPHLEHQMLRCMGVVRQLSFEDLANMYGRRGYVLLVHGLVQARASDVLGDDWAPCVAEVARVLEVLARKNDGDLARNSRGEDVDIDFQCAVQDGLSALDADATAAVTTILSRRGKELQEMACDEKKASVKEEPAPRAKRAKKSRPSIADEPTLLRSPKKKVSKSPTSKKSQPAVAEGSARKASD